MWLRNFFQSLTATSTRRPIRRSLRASRPGVELLEDRCVPSFSQPVELSTPSGGYYRSPWSRPISTATAGSTWRPRTAS